MSTPADFREHVIQMGPTKAHLGFLTRPLSPSTDPALENAAVVILSAGIIHRVGANRMHVQLARRLAREGLPTIRFDQSGLGDTPPRREATSLIDACMADYSEVLDWLEAEHGLTRIILFGLCAGADHGLLYAGRDDRVIGLVLLDQTLPRTNQYHLNHAALRLKRLASKTPGQAVSRILEPLRTAAFGRQPAGTTTHRAEAPLPPDAEEAALDFGPERSDSEIHDLFLEPYRRAIAANQEILAIFTGGLENRHNYREQILDAYPEIDFGGRLTLHYMDESDHAFTRERDREAMTRHVIDWLKTPLGAK